jgi:hypothetical protein
MSAIEIFRFDKNWEMGGRPRLLIRLPVYRKTDISHAAKGIFIQSFLYSYLFRDIHCLDSKSNYGCPWVSVGIPAGAALLQSLESDKSRAKS